MANAFFANWRQNIIYIGFVVVFLVFAVMLADKGFLIRDGSGFYQIVEGK